MRVCYFEAGFPEPGEAFFSLTLVPWHCTSRVGSECCKTHKKSLKLEDKYFLLNLRASEQVR